jgi:hypothetical protein
MRVWQASCGAPAWPSDPSEGYNPSVFTDALVQPHSAGRTDMIVRLWRGWTTAANADGYEELIRSTIFPDILDRGLDGLFRLDLYRHAGEVEPSS